MSVEIALVAFALIVGGISLVWVIYFGVLIVFDWVPWLPDLKTARWIDRLFRPYNEMNARIDQYNFEVQMARYEQRKKAQGGRFEAQ